MARAAGPDQAYLSGHWPCNRPGPLHARKPRPAAFLPFQWVTPSWPDLALPIAVGIVGGLARITISLAFRYADVAIVVPFEYTAMIWAVVLGFLIWGEIPAA